MRARVATGFGAVGVLLREGAHAGGGLARRMRWRSTNGSKLDHRSAALVDRALFADSYRASALR